jgi:hypothetical protein
MPSVLGSVDGIAPFDRPASRFLLAIDQPYPVHGTSRYDLDSRFGETWHKGLLVEEQDFKSSAAHKLRATTPAAAAFANMHDPAYHAPVISELDAAHISRQVRLNPYPFSSLSQSGVC